VIHIIEHIKNYHNKLEHSNGAAWAIFFLIVTLFIIIRVLITDMTSAIMVIDETLYLSTARSLHNSGMLLFQAQPANISHLLYPLVLSIVYFLYSPESIMFSLRLFGMLVYSLGFIPVFLLSKTILKSATKALIVVVIVLFLPEAGYVGFISQEVTHFPLMMLAFYLIYLTIQSSSNTIRTRKDVVYSIALGATFYLLYENKAIGIIAVISYIFCLFLIGCFFIGNNISIKKSIKATIKQLILVLLPFVLLFVLFGFVKNYLFVRSGIDSVNSHFSAAEYFILHYLRNDFIVFTTERLTGMLFYFYYLLIAFLGIPLIAFMGIKSFDKNDQKFLLHTIGFTVLSIMMIVFTVYIFEGGASANPQRVHLRYVYYSFVPFKILAFKLINKRIHINFLARYTLIFILLYTLVMHDRLNILFGSAYDNMSLFVFFASHHILNRLITDRILLLIITSVAVIAICYFKKEIFLSKVKFFVISIVLCIYFITNSYAHLRFLELYIFEAYNKCDSNYVEMARAINEKEQVLLIGGCVFDFNFFRLDTFLQHDHNYVAYFTLLRHLKNSGNGKIDLRNIIPDPWAYKFPSSPLGEVEYVVIPGEYMRWMGLRNAERITSGDSPLFDVYRISDSIIELEYITRLRHGLSHITSGDVILFFGNEYELENQARIFLEIDRPLYSYAYHISFTDSVGNVFHYDLANLPMNVEILAFKAAEEQSFSLRIHLTDINGNAANFASILSISTSKD